MKSIIKIFTGLFLIIATQLNAQENNGSSSFVVPSDQVDAPWGGKITQADTYLMNFIQRMGVEIGQVAACSADKGQILWICTELILTDWKETISDPSFFWTIDKSNYAYSTLQKGARESLKKTLEMKENNQFSCKNAGEVYAKSVVWEKCSIKK